MTEFNLTVEVRNISTYINGVGSRAPFISMVGDVAHVTVDNLGEFSGDPKDVLCRMVAEAKKKTTGLKN
jgi:2'-5' RNA ligase